MTQETSFADKPVLRELNDIIKNAPPLKPLWGDYLFRGKLTFITGAAGISKTTMGYDLSRHIILGDSFLGIKPYEKTNVCYFDFESDDALIGARGRLLRFDQQPVPGFFVYNYIGVYFPEVANSLAKMLPELGIGLIIIDNQSTAFNTHDENEATEAKREMQKVRELLRKTDCAGILFHHPGKANSDGLNKGRGSYARVAHADVVLNLDSYKYQGEEYIMLTMAKNRLVLDKQDLCYLKKEGEFIRTEPPEGLLTSIGLEMNISKMDGMRLDIVNCLKSSEEVDINTILGLPTCIKVSRQAVHQEIQKLIVYGLVVRNMKGKYSIKK